MILEPDEVVIDPAWDAARIKAELDGMRLYFHNIVPPQHWVVKTIRELEEMGVIVSVTLHTK